MIRQMLRATMQHGSFDSINTGYDAVLKAGELSLGIVVPIEAYGTSAVPEMVRHIERAQLAESLGFSAIWLRDVPFNVSSFGDAGQVFDPFVYLGALTAQTTRIALGVASIILPLRHPAQVAKAAATADVLSSGRLLLGVASGDRPEEYPALAIPYDQRGELFRESFNYIRQMAEQRPQFQNTFGRVGSGMDMLPKPTVGKLPLLITGSSLQSAQWIAANGDGWMTYPRPADSQYALIDEYRRLLATAGEPNKPVIEPLYIDLSENSDTPPTPIHLGLHLGVNALREYLASRRAIGINHVALNLRFNRRDTETTLTTLAEQIVPEFSH